MTLSRPKEQEAVPSTGARRNALLALLLLVPAPTLGTWFGLFSDEFRGTPLGQSVYAVSKVWILLLPVLWLFLVDRGGVSWSPARRGGIGVGAVTGLLLSAIILIAWLVAGRHLVDLAPVRETAAAAGLADPLRYGLFALYICTLNAVLEEYVWRWFVFRKSEDLLRRAGAGAVVLSALFFTLHHVFALKAQFAWLPALLAAAGVFVGGCVWSGLYLRYRSIWPGFVSHVIVDITIFAIGAWILFLA